MKKIPSFNLLCSLLLLLALAGCGTNQPSAPTTPDTLFFAPDTVEVTGVIRRDNYLSVMEGSRKEMINEAVVIELDRPVAIVSNPESAKAAVPALKNITRIEVANEFDYNFWELFGKRVTVKGTITRIGEAPGFHRQMSTPVEIHVMKLTVLGE